MKDFSKSKIYVVRSPNSNEVYIGSTTQPLSVRMGVHRSKSNSCYSKTIISAGEAYIELLEVWPCSNIEELRAREGHHHRTFLNCINKNIAGRTVKQYYLDNSAKINKYKNAKNECICGGKYSTSNKSHHENSLKHQTFIHQMKSTK